MVLIHMALSLSSWKPFVTSSRSFQSAPEYPGVLISIVMSSPAGSVRGSVRASLRRSLRRSVQRLGLVGPEDSGAPALKVMAALQKDGDQPCCVASEVGGGLAPRAARGRGPCSATRVSRTRSDNAFTQ